MLRAALAAPLAALPHTPSARTAAAAIRIGVLLPLTGPSASAGAEARAGCDVAADIVNRPYPALSPLPLAATQGLPRLGGAPLELVYADHGSDPMEAVAAAARLIEQERVAALFGGIDAAAMLAVSVVAERAGIPCLVPDTTALPRRGMHCTFRTAPSAPETADFLQSFLAEMGRRGQDVSSIAVVQENSEYGFALGAALEAANRLAGTPLALRVIYAARAQELSGPASDLKRVAPRVVILASYTADAVTLMDTFRALDVLPPMLIGDGAGFSDPAFVADAGALAQGMLNRVAWTGGSPGSLAARVAAAFQARTGRELSDPSALAIQGMLVLTDALDRAGSTDPIRLRDALAATDWPETQVFVTWRGVRFDDTGQNQRAASALAQLRESRFVPVWPDSVALQPIVWPMRGWKG